MLETYNKKLIEVLKLVAAEVNIQVSAFPGFVHVPDEIASEVSDAIEYAPEVREDKDTEILTVLIQIDKILDKYAGQEGFWTVQSMQENFAWQQIRLIARGELQRLEVSEDIPDLFWLQYLQQ